MSLGKACFFLTAALTFFAAPAAAAQLSAVSGSLLLVVLGVALAWAASESVSAVGAAAGAVGAFAGTILATGSIAIGTGVFVAAAYTERTMRVAGTGAKLLHVGGAFASGALAGTVATCTSALWPCTASPSWCRPCSRRPLSAPPPTIRRPTPSTAWRST